MALPAPAFAPDHERVTFPSAKVVLNEHDVGAPQAVMLQYSVVPILRSDITPSASMVEIETVV